MRPLLPLILAALCAAPARAEVHEVVPAAQAAALPAPAATHRLPVQFVILRGSRWTWAHVQARAAKVVEVLAECGVRVDPTIVELTPPGPNASVIYNHERTNEPTGMATIVSALTQPKPTIFYIAGFPDNPTQGGTSRARYSAVGMVVPEVDTAWIPFRDPPPPDHANYSVDAHELIHVVGDMSHWTPEHHAPPGHIKGTPDPSRPEPGMMVKYPHMRTNLLHPYVCERILKFPLVTPL